MENQFEQLGLSPQLIEALAKQGIETPTHIQRMLIPKALEGADIIARSQTGSGKTLAYLLPIFQQIDMSVRGTQAIILTPTHELAAQVFHQAELLAEDAGMAEVGCALLIGAAGISRQMEKLKAKPRVVVGSTGRILDLIGRKKIQAHQVKTVVLDEGDRLLEDGNYMDVQAVLRTMLKERQIILLSASVSEATKARVTEIMKPGRLDLETDKGGLVPEGIAHYYMLSTAREKFLNLRKIIAGENPERAIVFINNPENIEVIVDKLCYHGIKAVGIYGKVGKVDRKNAMDDFREGRARVLVASDIGARGLDIPGITHVINMDVPEEATHYLHRAGRCGRKGEDGTAITLVTPYERRWVHRYAKVWGLSFEQKEMSFGKLVDSTKTKNDIQQPYTKGKAEAGKSKQDAEGARGDGQKDLDQYLWDTPKKAEKKASKKAKPATKKPAFSGENKPATDGQEQAQGFLAKKAQQKAKKEQNRMKSKK